MDWVDVDPIRINSGLEDTYYQLQEPPYRAANAPLMSIDELYLIEGFDRHARRGSAALYHRATLRRGVRGSISTPRQPHVLSLIYFNNGVDDRLGR